MNTEKELIYRLYIQRESSFVRTDIESEFSRYDDIKKGYVSKVIENFETIKKDFYQGKGKLSDNPIRNNIYHLVVSAGIIARLCVDAGMPHTEAYTLSDIYIRKADTSKSPEEVIDLIGTMQIDFATRMHNLKKADMVSPHIRHSIDYIYNHLHEHLTMKQLATVEKLDPSYFSKLFAKETGTTVKAYILRCKINTAKNMLESSGYSINEIAFSLGFSSQSAFTAAFNKQIGTTPAKYRKELNYIDMI